MNIYTVRVDLISSERKTVIDVTAKTSLYVKLWKRIKRDEVIWACKKITTGRKVASLWGQGITLENIFYKTVKRQTPNVTQLLGYTVQVLKQILQIPQFSAFKLHS